jgi:hypothetical protein
MPIYTSGTHAEGWDDSGLPKSVREYLAYGAEPGNRDNALFAAACQFRDAGFSEADATPPLVARAIADGLNETTARRKIRSAYSKGQREPAAAANAPTHTQPSTEKTASSAQSGATVSHLPAPMADGFRVLLETAFQKGERVSIGRGTRGSDGELQIDYGDTRSRNSWLKAGPPQYPEGTFIRINPMKYRGAKDDEVTTWRHALVEFDSGDKENHYALLIESGLPITAIINSGDRGLHAWIRVDAANRVEYDQRVETVYALFKDKGSFDPKNKNPSRYSRLPGGNRMVYRNGKANGSAPQELLAIKVGSVSWAQYVKDQSPTDDDLEELTRKRRFYYEQMQQPMPAPMNQAAYYGKAGEIVDIIRTAGTEACPESLLIQFLIAYGNLVGRNPYRHQGATHHLNEFGALVGESGTGCKGTSWNALYDLLELLDSDWLDNRVQSGFPSGEGIITSIKDPRTRLFRGKWITEPGEKDKRLLILEEEFSQILVAAEREGNNISIVLRNAWDGRKVLAAKGKNDPCKATGGHVSLIAHITPRELRKRLSDIDMTNGFANRIIWIAVAGIGDVPIPPRIDWRTQHPHLLQDLGDIITNFQTRPASGMDWSSEARILWNQYHRNQKNRKFSGLIEPILRRSIAHVLRLSMIYAILDNSNLIGTDHLQAAMAVIDYSERSIQWCFGQKTGDQKADQIFWELERTPEGLTKTEIFKICRHHTATELNMKLAILRDSGLADLSFERTSHSDKPIERWYSTRYLK